MRFPAPSGRAWAARAHPGAVWCRARLWRCCRSSRDVTVTPLGVRPVTPARLAGAGPAGPASAPGRPCQAPRRHRVDPVGGLAGRRRGMVGALPDGEADRIVDHRSIDFGPMVISDTGGTMDGHSTDAPRRTPLAKPLMAAADPDTDGLERGRRHNRQRRHGPSPRPKRRKASTVDNSAQWSDPAGPSREWPEPSAADLIRRDTRPNSSGPERRNHAALCISPVQHLAQPPTDNAHRWPRESVCRDYATVPQRAAAQASVGGMFRRMVRRAVSRTVWALQGR